MTDRMRLAIVSLGTLAVFASAGAIAQSQPKQVVKPPVAQAWIDVATFSGFAMGGGMGAGMMNSTLGALMGGGKNAKAEFGYTQTGTAGRWMDVTLYTSRNPNLAEALQNVPDGTAARARRSSCRRRKSRSRCRASTAKEPVEWNYEPPKGKLVMYWGCSETVRPGQPKIVNLETATIAELGKFFESRRATQRGTHAAVGRPVWPSKVDKRALPAGASIVGRTRSRARACRRTSSSAIPAAQDVMPEIDLRQTDKGSFVLLEWNALPTARAYFLGSMGSCRGGGDDVGMVIWTSSELPDCGFGLFDYQTNAAVDKWLKDKVLLPPTTTNCAVPKEAAGQGMLRAIAYGTELNMAYPPRPTDPKIAWEPDWNVKIRVKSMTTTMMGMEGGMPEMGGTEDAEDMTDAPAAGRRRRGAAEEPKKKKKC